MTIKPPGFTAASTLYRSRGRYRIAGSGTTSPNWVMPATISDEQEEQFARSDWEEPQSPASDDTHTSVLTPAQGEDGSPAPQEMTGPTLHGAEPGAPSYVFALGRIEPRFPSLAVEKEFAQVAGRADTAGLTDRETLHAVLTERENRYLVQQLCWVFMIEGLEHYLLVPRDPLGFDLLLEASRPIPSPMDIDVVIGSLGPIAPPEMCNGLMIPLVVFDHLYSFDRDALLKAIPRPEKIAAKAFESAAEELYERIMQLADNSGATDQHRALNYLAVRYPPIYATAAEAFGRSASLTGVEVQSSRLSGVRNIVNVIFSYTARSTEVTEKYFVRVDVTEEFPFLITRLSPFYDR